MVPPGLLDTLRYKPGWSFKLGGPDGRFLCVFARTPDSLRPESQRVTQHMLELPATECPQAWARWLLEQLLLIERHEACEFLQVGDGRPFWPHHQDQGSPYELVDRGVLPCRCGRCRPI